jgi:rhamnogalacturonan endolyase
MVPGVFGQYVQDNVAVKAGNSNSVVTVTWKEESAGKLMLRLVLSAAETRRTSGKEIWRLGTPDKTAGEFRHGFAPDPKKALHPEEYRI